MTRNKVQNKSAAVLLTVIILTMVLSVIVVSIMSLNVSQVKTSQSIIDSMKAEYLGQAYFYKHHAETTLTGTSANLPSSESSILNQKKFEITGSILPSVPINEIKIDISF